MRSRCYKIDFLYINKYYFSLYILYTFIYVRLYTSLKLFPRVDYIMSVMNEVPIAFITLFKVAKYLMSTEYDYL